MNILEEMKSRDFSALEQEIVDYVLAHAREVPQMTIRELAAATYSSNASILRLCRKLGLAGYRSFVIELVRAAEHGPEQQLDWNMPFSSADPVDDIIRTMNRMTGETSEITASSLDPDILRESSRVLLNSDRIFTTAIGDSAALTDAFRHMMLKLGRFLIPVELTGDTGAFAASATSRDCLLAVSYSGTSSTMIRTAREFRRHGAVIITVTAGVNEGLAAASDLVIGFPRRAGDTVEIGPFYARTAVSCVLDTLYAVLYSLRWQENEKRRQASEISGRNIDSF